MVLGYRYNEKIDIWSVGCILAELYSGKVLFPSDSNQCLLAQVVSCFGAFPLEMLTQCKNAGQCITKSGLIYGESEDRYEVLVPFRLPLRERIHSDSDLFIDFLLQLLCPILEWRASAEEALNHPWLEQVL